MERRPDLMKKRRFCQRAFKGKVRAKEGHPPVHGEITVIEPVPKEHHLELLRARVDDRSTVPKEVSQCSDVLGRFPGRYEPVQNNGNHVPIVNEHGILVDLLKIV
jgi:hypothetical protein